MRACVNEGVCQRGHVSMRACVNEVMTMTSSPGCLLQMPRPLQLELLFRSSS